MQTLKQAREERGIKQEAVALALGVTRQTYARYEEDQCAMSVEKAKLACAFIGAEFDDIFFAERVETI